MKKERNVVFFRWHKKEKQRDELDDKIKMAKKNETDEKLKKVKKKVVGGATAAGLGASVLLGGLFESPEELMQKNKEALQSQQPSPIVMTVNLDEEDTDEDNDSEENSEEESIGLFAKIKKKILELPAGIRAIVGVPLWAIGWVIIHVLSIAWEAVLAPVLGFLLKWVLAGLALVGVFAAAMKCAFPHLPLKKILRPKNILFLVLGTVILGVLDKVIPLFWAEYTGYRFLVMLGGGLIVLLAVGIPFIIKQVKTQKEEERKALEAEEKKSIAGHTIENTLELVKKAEKLVGIESFSAAAETQSNGGKEKKP
ncbi:MAG: hypothetical protein IKG00_06190 [Lachnospiraceae bacterium]|nr:hypothetical protein [Lachnospiraceae bacterium]